jgi:hypothetical protein
MASLHSQSFERRQVRSWRELYSTFAVIELAISSFADFFRRTFLAVLLFARSAALERCTSEPCVGLLLGISAKRPSFEPIAYSLRPSEKLTPIVGRSSSGLA